MLVDTLYDERLAAEMLAGVQDVSGFAVDAIRTLVNVHLNGDHTFGKQLLTNARFIASAAAHAMRTDDASKPPAALMKRTGEFGEVGLYHGRDLRCFGFAGVRQRLPDKTFSGEKRITAGDKEIHLIEVGPAHTAGDTMIHIPKDRTVYTGYIPQDSPYFQTAPNMSRKTGCAASIRANCSTKGCRRWSGMVGMSS